MALRVHTRGHWTVCLGVAMLVRISVLLAFVLLYAVATASYAFAPPQSTLGNVTTVGTGNITAASVGQATFSTASNGSVYVNTGIRVATGGGRSIPIVLDGTVPKASVAGAIGRFLGKSLPVLGAGYALWELAQELGFTLDNGTGPVVVTRAVTSYTYEVNCRASSGQPPGDAARRGSPEDLLAFCQAAYQAYWRNNGYPSCTAGAGSITGTYGSALSLLLGNNLSCGNNLTARTAAYVSSAPGSVPSTPQEFVDAVAAESGWPSSSALARTLKDAVASGEVVPVQVDEVTGPATSPGTSTVADNVPSPGQRTRVVEEQQHAYDGDKVTTTTTRTTTVEDMATGDPIGVPQVTTETPALPQPQELPEIETCGLPGKPACRIDEEGTPPAPELEPAQDVADAMRPLQDLIDDPASVLPALPDLNWTFSLPTACGSIGTPAFAPYLESIDVCQFQPVFHDLMSVVWVIGGLFGAIGTFWRNVFSQN